MNLNSLLLGPILRRAEQGRTFIWIATSRRASVVAEVFRANNGDPGDLQRVGGGAAESLRLGERLFVHLACATPAQDEWPPDELLAYDLRIAFTDDEEPVMGLRDFGLLDGPNAITYGDWPLPTFFVREKTPTLNVVHGSCRLLHGRGEDALTAADDLLADVGEDLDERPRGLFLTGDQIYADDVASPLISHVRALATELMGERDDTSVPGVERMSGFIAGDRQDLVRDRACFTSAHCDNHLMSFGEFAAMYVCAWNHENWPSTWPDPNEVETSSQTRANEIRSRRTWTGQTRALDRARAALPAVRRVLANVPTYMIFDDHDVTDDWNLTQVWARKVKSSDTGRRVVANALASFWAFQGWGNNPDEFDKGFKAAVSDHLSGGQEESGPEADAFDSTLWSWDKWSFYAPTKPPLLCTDTRTQRAYDSPEGAARLIGRTGLRRLAGLARASGLVPGDPLVLVSPVPVFGFELQERRQKYLLDKLGPYEIDFEAWHSNLRGLVDLMNMIIEDIQPAYVVLLSGDVHYGVNARAAFQVKGREISIIQLVSSGQKHAGVIASAGINALGHVLKARHERLGWEETPETERLAWLKDRILGRAVNTDEWSGVSPVFVAPRDARLLKIEQDPDYRECRVYIRPEEPRSSFLMGLNNVGVVSLRDGKVQHRLLGRDRDHTETRTAVMDAETASLFD